MAESSATQRDLIEQLADSFLTSYRAGQRPSVDAYVERYPELADQLRDLIAALVVLEQNAPQRPGREDILDSPRRGAAPREIGEFTIVREIGRGGMGVVYEAVQQSLGRHVALKVLSVPGLMNPVQLERFRLEARSAGRLHHSHIVPVFGVGEHDGLHYYAMQFIPGQSLGQVIDELRKLRSCPDDEVTEEAQRSALTESLANGLLTGRYPGQEREQVEVADCPADPPTAPSATLRSPRIASADASPHSQFTSGSSGRPFYESVARVGLQVAEALAYAHSEGILHRDIKPSNLLLDAKGNTWVTDFGLVKAEDSQSLTDTGDFVGTLRYMAPERLEGQSDPLGDIYGLGATLYELLTLRTIHQSSGRSQLIEQILHADPVPPSKIDPSIPRDLETIVRKCLEKDPRQRYASARLLVDDLARWLAGEPIRARPVGRIERAWQWSKRNPKTAILVGTVLALLVGVALVSTIAAVRINAARNQAADSLVEAEFQRQRAEEGFREARNAVDNYFTAVSENRLLNEPGLQPLRRELLQSALDYYQKFVQTEGTDPSVRQSLAHAYARIGNLANEMGRKEEAEAAYRKYIEMSRRLVLETPEAEEYQRDLGGAYSQLGNLVAGAARRNEAERYYRQSLEIFERLSKNHPLNSEYQRYVAVTKIYLGILLFVMGRKDEAETAIQAAIGIQQSLASHSPEEKSYQQDLAYSYRSYALLLSTTERKLDAEDSCGKALQISERLAREDPRSLAFRHELGLTHVLLGNLQFENLRQAEAEASYRKALDINQRLADENPTVAQYWFDLATNLDHLGKLFAVSDRQADAIEAYRKALEINERLAHDYPEDSGFRYHLGARHAHLAAWFVEIGRKEDAQANYRKAIEVRERIAAANPEDSGHQLNLAETYENLADLIGDAASHPEAEALVRKSLEVRARMLPGSPNGFPADLAYRHEKLGHELLRSGRLNDAEPLVRKALDIRLRLAQEIPGDVRTQVDLANCYDMLGCLEVNLGHRVDGDRFLRQEVKIRERLLRDNPNLTNGRVDLALAYGHLGWFLAKASQSRDALEPLKRSAGLLEELQSKNSCDDSCRIQLVTLYQNLALAQGEVDQNSEAEATLIKAVEVAKQVAISQPKELGPLSSTYAFRAGLWAFKGHGSPDAALEAAEEAVRLMPVVYPFALTRAAVYYRLSRFKDSARELGRARALLTVSLLAPENASPHSSTRQYQRIVQLLWAMNQHQLGQRQEARRSLETAMKWLAEAEAVPMPEIRFTSDIDPRLISCLVSEAKSLILEQGGAVTADENASDPK